MRIRSTLATLLAVSVACFAQGAVAQDGGSAKWPSKPIRIVVPAPAGIAPDIFARLYAAEMQKSFGVPVTVDNRPGASAIIGTAHVAKSSPDGYTVLYGFNQIVTMNPHLFNKLPYDAKQLQPLSQVVTGAYLILANKDFGPNNVAELLASAKSQPGKVTYGSYGPGTASHLGFELIEAEASIKLLHVPYKQGVLNDVIGGLVAMTIEPTGSGMQFVRNGKVKALAYTGAKRLDTMPDVPTLSETIPGLVIPGWNGFWVPAGTPKAVADSLSAEILRITRLPETRKRMAEAGFEPTGTSAEEMAAIIKRESATWGAVIKAKNIRLD